MVWQIATQILSIVVLVLVCVLDYRWTDKRTTKHKRIRTLLFVGLFALLFLNPVGVIKSESKMSELRELLKGVQQGLAPFEELAGKLYPAIGSEEALKKLQADLTQLEKRTSVVEEKAASRQIAPERRQSAIKALAPFRGNRLEVSVLANDSEAGRFAYGLKESFEAAGWIVNLGYAVFNRPFQGVEFYAKQPQQNESAKSALRALQMLGISPRVYIDPQLSEDMIKIFVGSKE